MQESRRQGSARKLGEKSKHADLGLFDRFLELMEQFVDHDATRALIGRSWQ